MTQPKTTYGLWVNSETRRQEALDVLSNAALPFAVAFKRDKRTGKQNSRQWAILETISREAEWHGQKLSKEDWKIIFMQALYAETRMVPNLDNDGFVALGRSSSSLTVAEHSDLTALIEAWANNHGIDVTEPKRNAA